MLLASPEHVGLALCACHLKTYGSLSMSMSSMLCFEALGILCGLVTCLILSVAMRSRMLSACRFCMRCFLLVFCTVRAALCVAKVSCMGTWCANNCFVVEIDMMGT